MSDDSIPISTAYTIEVIDFPVETSARTGLYPYKSTLKINLQLVYRFEKISHKRIFEYCFPLGSMFLGESYSIDTFKQMFESVTAENFSDNMIRWKFDKDNNLNISIINENKLGFNSNVINLRYKLLIPEAKMEIPRKNKIGVNRYKRTERIFSLPIYNDARIENIRLNIILPKGWESHYGKLKYKEGLGIEMISSSNEMTSSSNTSNHFMAVISNEDLLREEEGRENSPYLHYWTFKENNASVWSLIINRKSVNNEINKELKKKIGKLKKKIDELKNNIDKKQKKIEESKERLSNLQIIPIENLKIISIWFAMFAGTKNKLIVTLAGALAIFSGIFAIMFSLILFTDKNPDYVNYLFADVGLLTVIFAYFFSYAVQKNSGMILCMSGNYIKNSIIFSLLMIGVCLLILIFTFSNSLSFVV